MPTIWARMSSLPNSDRVVATMRSTSASEVVSASTTSAVPPSSVISLAVSSAAARLTSATTTFAPSRAKVSAVHLPLPQPGPELPPPLTIATLPSKRPVIGYLPCAALIGPAGDSGQDGAQAGLAGGPPDLTGRLFRDRGAAHPGVASLL